MARKRVQTRLPEPLADKLEEYREANHMNQAEAVRHLLRVGLDAETPDEPDEVEQAIDEATEAATDDADEYAHDGIPDEMDVFGMSGTIRLVGGAAITVLVIVIVALQGGATALAAALAAFMGAVVGGSS